MYIYIYIHFFSKRKRFISFCSHLHTAPHDLRGSVGRVSSSGRVSEKCRDERYDNARDNDRCSDVLQARGSHTHRARNCCRWWQLLLLLLSLSFFVVAITVYHFFYPPKHAVHQDTVLIKKYNRRNKYIRQFFQVAKGVCSFSGTGPY